jgi:hypothetical protein
MWMDKQERAFTAWLNSMLMPYTPDYLRMKLGEDQNEALASRRLTAQVTLIL